MGQRLTATLKSTYPLFPKKADAAGQQFNVRFVPNSIQCPGSGSNGSRNQHRDRQERRSAEPRRQPSSGCRSGEEGEAQHDHGGRVRPLFCRAAANDRRLEQQKLDYKRQPCIDAEHHVYALPGGTFSCACLTYWLWCSLECPMSAVHKHPPMTWQLRFAAKATDVTSQQPLGATSSVPNQILRSGFLIAEMPPSE
jgi:hypothetical protein